MAVLLLPFAKLPPLWAALTWFYVKAALTLLALHWIFRLVEGDGRPFPPWARALAVLLSLRPILGDLQHGNVNLFILFLVVAGLTAYRRGRDLLAGLVARLATHSPSFSTYVDNVYTPTRYDNLLDLTPAQARWLVKGCMALFALAVVWPCRTPTTPRHGWRLAAEFSLVVLG